MPDERSTTFPVAQSIASQGVGEDTSDRSTACLVDGRRATIINTADVSDIQRASARGGPRACMSVATEEGQSARSTARAHSGPSMRHPVAKARSFAIVHRLATETYRRGPIRARSTAIVASSQSAPVLSGQSRTSTRLPATSQWNIATSSAVTLTDARRRHVARSR